MNVERKVRGQLPTAAHGPKTKLSSVGRDSRAEVIARLENVAREMDADPLYLGEEGGQLLEVRDVCEASPDLQLRIHRGDVPSHNMVCTGIPGTSGSQSEWCIETPVALPHNKKRSELSMPEQDLKYVLITPARDERQFLS